MPKVDKEYLEQKRSHILGSAKACFSANGFHKTTMRDILKKSGLSAGAVYRYFKGKEDIIEALARQDLEDRIGMIERSLNDEDFAGRIDMLAASFLSPLDQDEKAYISLELELWAEAKRNPKIMKIQSQSLKAIKKRFAIMIKNEQEKRNIHPDLDAEAVATVFVSFRRGLMAQMAVEKNIDVGGYVATIMSMMKNSFMMRTGEKKRL